MPMKKILLVDDCIEILDLLEIYLEEEPMVEEIFKVSSGNEAIEHLKKHEYSLIISDYQMDDGDGASVFRFVKNDHGDTPFLFIGADLPDLSDWEIHVLPKPFDKEKFLKTIREVSSRKNKPQLDA